MAERDRGDESAAMSVKQLSTLFSGRCGLAGRMTILSYWIFPEIHSDLAGWEFDPGPLR